MTKSVDKTYDTNLDGSEQYIEVSVISPVLFIKRKTIRNNLAELQSIVGGYIQIVPINNEGLVAICDEEGRLKDKPCNCWLTACPQLDFCGTIIICRTRGEELTSLTEDDFKLIPNLLVSK